MDKTKSVSAFTRIVRVAVIETSVYDALAYHFRCLECGREGKRHDGAKGQSIAAREAKAHGERCTGKRVAK